MVKAYIWGAAVRGNVAFHYYKDECNIVGFIDNDKTKWGTIFNDCTVYSPDVLLTENDCKIIVAVQSKVYAEEIRSQVESKYGICQCTHFTFDSKPLLPVQSSSEITENSVVVTIDGGLGNQMFQYAVYRNFELRGKDAIADLSFYDWNPGVIFAVDKIFPNVKLNYGLKTVKEDLLSFFSDNNLNIDRLEYYREKVNPVTKQRFTSLDILDIEFGFIQGFHQNHEFADMIRTDLLSQFTFDISSDNLLEKMCKKLSNEEYVSVHVRRGDYLNPRYYNILGDVCDKDYYEKAISRITSMVPGCKLIFFSNDMEWVKGNLKYDGALYNDESFYEHYEDWYDMCLMSKCKHNIIANSTFSWWGAWLNQNPTKLVIAPKTWVKNIEVVNIIEENWIRI